ncbi:MAG: hypothetical protein MK538_17485, partial [Planctomycetes bacterium]|nr:hypothetical protein [Planctomycetota bacterium]
ETYLRVKNASDVGLTAFALYALARNPRKYSAVDGPFISDAVEFLINQQQKNGAIYDPRDPTLLNYKTSVTILALSSLNRSKYSGTILRARSFTESLQFAEARGYNRSKHLSYGGIGYGSGLRPDLSNTQFALEAVRAAGLSQSDELWVRVQPFLRLSLNSEKLDPRLAEHGIGTTKDGGARYAPNATRGPVETLDDGRRGFSSYGSMSYAALKSFLYAHVARDDPDVRGLFRWISRNYTVTENPGMATKKKPRAGLHGLFYYYHTMAKALRAYGEPMIRDAQGAERHWSSELASQLLSMQTIDGSWKNTSDRWYENLPTLDTSYAIVTLVECMEQMRDEMSRAKSGQTSATSRAKTKASTKTLKKSGAKG